MNVRPSFIADLQPPVSIQPREGPLHNPPIAPQPLRAFHTPSGDPRGDPKPSQPKLLLGRIIGFVRMQLLGPLSGPAPRTLDRLNGIEGRFHHPAVVDVGCREGHRQRDAVLVDHKMALRPLFAAIRRIRPGRCAPPGAGTVAESKEARDQSILSASPSRSSSAWCKSFQTPACCQDRSLRQQVMPLPQPISLGNISQGMPVINTNTIPVSTFRSGMGGRPPFGLGLGGGRSGWITAQSSSETISLAILTHLLLGPYYKALGGVLLGALSLIATSLFCGQRRPLQFTVA